MDADTLERALEEAGLTGQQAEAYLTLLELGPSPVVEIAQESSVSSSRIYDVVRGLDEMGFVETVERDRLHARPREPVDVLNRLRNKSEMLADAASEIEDRWERPEPLESRVSVHKRRDTVIRTAADAIGEATVSVELALTPEQLAELQPTIEAVTADRDVAFQVSVYDASGRDVPAPDGVLEMRRNPVPGPFLAIVDRRNAFFAPNVHGDELYGITIGDEILSFILHWFFLTCQWTGKESIYVDTDQPPTYVSIDEFVHNMAPLLREDITMTLRIIGRQSGMGGRTEIVGDLVKITSNGGFGIPPEPTHVDLSGQLTLFVATADDTYSVGSWGALIEDLEAEIVRVEDISFSTP